MTEQQLEEFGRAWVRHLRQKTRCFELAADICGGDLDVLERVRNIQKDAEEMPPLAVAVLTLHGWGADIPQDLLAKADCVRVTHPGTPDTH